MTENIGGSGFQLRGTFDTAARVLTDPRGFFAALPRSGGYEAPALFAVTMLIAEGVLLALLSLLHLAYGGFFASLLMVPIFGGVGLLIGAAILLFISRALGGESDYESSFRIVAYSSAILPLHAVAEIVPYVPILVSAFGLYITIVAVIVVHRVPEQKAWTVLGGIGAVLLLFSLSATIAARRMAPKLDRFQKQIENSAKELEKATQQMQREMEKQQQPAAR